MQLSIARQPIFNRRQKVIGYELLYRNSSLNAYLAVDGSRATLELISNAFLSIGIDTLASDKMAFINFTADAIIRDVPSLLPGKRIVVEILETAMETEALVKACRKLKDKGYLLALDDYLLDDSRDELFQLADIIKVEFSQVPVADQKKLIQRCGNDKQMLAEKIETREDHQLASQLGYHLFQGYFYSKPVMFSRPALETHEAIAFRLIRLLNDPDPDMEKVADLFETDLDLSYKLLKLVNSAYYSKRHAFSAIRQAIIYIGVNELRKWLFLLLIKRYETDENAEMLKECVIRGRMMELAAKDLHQDERCSDCFLVGLFSTLDQAINMPMQDIVDELPLSKTISDALLGHNNHLRQMLDIIVDYEQTIKQARQILLPANERETEREHGDADDHAKTKTLDDKDFFFAPSGAAWPQTNQTTPPLSAFDRAVAEWTEAKQPILGAPGRKPNGLDEKMKEMDLDKRYLEALHWHYQLAMPT